MTPVGNIAGDNAGGGALVQGSEGTRLLRTLVTEHNLLVTRFNALLTKLDADGGVTDNNYESTLEIT